MSTLVPQRILVTGGAGFIGSHTVDLLLKKNYEVVVLDNLSTGKLTNLDLTRPGLEFIEGNVLEYPYLEELMATCDAIIHLAAIASVPFSIENPIYTFQVNTQGFLHVLQAAHQNNRPIRIVYASSAAVYGNEKDLPCNDEKKLSSPPLSPYALQKIHDEDYAALYERLHGIKSIAMRYFNVYGERQDPQSPYSGVISRFLDLYKNKELLTVFGDGQQSRDFIHVQDVAQANWLALQNDYSGAVNIATGRAETLLNMIHYLEAAGGYKAQVELLPHRPGDILSSYAAVEKAYKQLGFRSTLSLADGLKELLL